MPSSLPTARDVHVNSLLTGFAVAYGQSLAGKYVADRAFTKVRSEKQSNNYPVWSKADFFRSAMDVRADGAPSKGGGFRVDTSNTYNAEVYGLHTYLSDRVRNNSKNELDVEKAKVRWLMNQSLLKRDKLWAAVAFVTGVWTGTTEQTGKSSAPSTNEFLQWNDASSTPFKDITLQKEAMLLASGVMPNVAVCNGIVASHLARHADFLGRVNGGATVGSPAIVSMEALAGLLGLDEIIVGDAVENTAAEGQTASMSRVLGNHFLLLHRTPEMSEDEPTAGAGFSWNEFDQVDATGASIASWYDKDRKATKYEAEMAIQYKITATDLGVMMLSATA